MNEEQADYDAQMQAEADAEGAAMQAMAEQQDYDAIATTPMGKCGDCGRDAPLNGDHALDGTPLVNCNCPAQSGVGLFK